MCHRESSVDGNENCAFSVLFFLLNLKKKKNQHPENDILGKEGTEF